jgi:hypothetical protein
MRVRQCKEKRRMCSVGYPRRGEGEEVGGREYKYLYKDGAGGKGWEMRKDKGR